MMFFNFQRFFAGFGSVLDPLLAQDNCTLEMILDEDTLQEIKLNGAQKFGNLYAFLIYSRYRIIKQQQKILETYSKMIGYLCVNEEEKQNEKTQIRYPFMISEAIGNENGPIIDYLFEADKSNSNYEENEEFRQEFLPKIFNVLDRDHLNVTLASYLSKVVCAIIRRRGYDLWRFLSQPEHKSILSNLIKNLDVFHVAEIIEKLIILDTNQEQQENQINFQDERNDFLRRVIRVFEYKTHQNDITDNCSHIFNEILNKSDLFLPVLNIPEKLFAVALNSSSATVVSVLITLLEAIHRFVQGQQEKNPSYHFSYSQIYPIAQEFKNALLAEKISISAFNTTFGMSQQPFSQMKLKLLLLYCQLNIYFHSIKYFIQYLSQLKYNQIYVNKKLLFVNIYHKNIIQGNNNKKKNLIYKLLNQQYLSILRINNVELINQFDHKGIFESLMKFVIEYEFNNQLQNYFYEITVFIFDRPQFENIQEDFLSLDLASFIMKHNRYEKENIGALNSKIRRGYVGILSKLAYYFINKFEKNEEWNQYVEQVLESVRTVESQYMLGVNPRPKIPIDTNDEGMSEMFRNFQKNKISQSNQQQQVQQQDEQQTVEVEEETEEQQNNDDADDNYIYNQKEEETLEQFQEVFSDKPGMVINVEEFEKVINSPETSPKVVEQIIQFQEQNLKTSPQASEIMTDKTVNKYWKAHEGQEHQEPGRKSSQDDIHKHSSEHHQQVKQEETQKETQEKHEIEQQIQPQENLQVEVQEVKVEEIDSPEEKQQQQEEQIQQEEQLQQDVKQQDEQQQEVKQEEQQQQEVKKEEQQQEQQKEQENKQEEEQEELIS